MSERSDKVKEMFSSAKSQEPATSENENTPEIETIEQPTQAQPEEPNEPEAEDFDLSGFESLNNTVAAKTGAQRGGGISVVNSSGKGKCKRVELSAAIMDYLGLRAATAQTIRFSFFLTATKLFLVRSLLLLVRIIIFVAVRKAKSAALYIIANWY